MEDYKQKWLMDTLSLHNSNLFSTLLYEHELTTDTLKEIEFSRKDGTIVDIRGFFAKKNRKKYWIDEDFVDSMPLRYGDKIEELKDRDDVVFRLLAPKAFKIIPQQTMTIRELIDDFAPFEHSDPKQWTFAKILSLVGYISKIYVCISTDSAFGKSSIFDLIHYLTDKSPVFKPRSIPGVLNQINGSGNMVFDETHRCKKEVRDIIEEFALQIGGGKSRYINGALKSANTKQSYSCLIQSITFLYNNTTNYKDPAKDYFEYIFSNNKAIDDRFLKVKLKGVLTEQFDKKFDIKQVAEENKMKYINYAKMLLYLQDARLTNSLERKWVTHTKLKHRGRRRQIYFEIAWLIDQYCESQIEYDEYIDLFDEAIQDYDDMVSLLKDSQIGVLDESVPASFDPNSWRDEE